MANQGNQKRIWRCQVGPEQVPREGKGADQRFPWFHRIGSMQPSPIMLVGSGKARGMGGLRSFGQPASESLPNDLNLLRSAAGFSWPRRRRFRNQSRRSNHRRICCSFLRLAAGKDLCAPCYSHLDSVFEHMRPPLPERAPVLSGGSSGSSSWESVVRYQQSRSSYFTQRSQP